MTLKNRFIILLIVLCGGLVGAIALLAGYERRESALIMEKVRQQRSDLLDRLMVLTGESLGKFVYEYAQWTEMLDFAKAKVPDTEWAEINIYSALEVYNTQVAWVLHPDGQVFYALESKNFPAVVTPPPPPRAELMGLFDRNLEVHFFYEAAGEIYEVHGGPIVPSVGWEETTVAHGYFLVARHWDESHLTKLSKLLDSHVSLLKPEQSDDEEPGRFGFSLQRNLIGMDGQPLRIFKASYNSLELMQAVEGDRWEATIFITYGLVLILIVALFTYLWILRPLRYISYSLTTSDVGPLESLLKEKSELGRVANLVKSWFHDREELRVALEERARMGRDLHDGVIQTLYASGMSLASIQTIMRKSPEEAETLIEQTRRELNSTIRDVRNFITRLEPESGNVQRFDRALKTLLDFMKGGLEVDCIVQVDEKISAELPMDIRAQLLQIVREAASNAFRHSGCTELRVSLAKVDQAIEFSITDNGRGFDPARIKSAGQGLRNFRERSAEIAATLDIVSQPGQGVTIRLTIPTDHHS